MDSISAPRGADDAIEALDRWLLARSYNARSRAGIAAHFRSTGRLDGACPDHLDADDLAGATEILERAGIGLMPISGGSPEPAPFVPSEADWADYRRHFDEVDRLEGEPRYGYE